MNETYAPCLAHVRWMTLRDIPAVLQLAARAGLELSEAGLRDLVREQHNVATVADEGAGLTGFLVYRMLPNSPVNRILLYAGTLEAIEDLLLKLKVKSNGATSRRYIISALAHAGDVVGHKWLASKGFRCTSVQDDDYYDFTWRAPVRPDAPDPTEPPF